MSPAAFAPTLKSLATAWRLRAQELRRWGAASNAETLERAASELTAAFDAMADELVTLERATELSGYSADHLRRLVREKKLPDLRRGKRQRLFRVGDLPLKPPTKSASVDDPRLVGYDPDADARMVARKRQHGG